MGSLLDVSLEGFHRVTHRSRAFMGRLVGFVHGNTSGGGFRRKILLNAGDIESNADSIIWVEYRSFSVGVVLFLCVVLTGHHVCSSGRTHQHTLAQRVRYRGGHLQARDETLRGGMQLSVLCHARSSVFCVIHVEGFVHGNTSGGGFRHMILLFLVCA